MGVRAFCARALPVPGLTGVHRLTVPQQAYYVACARSGDLSDVSHHRRGLERPATAVTQPHDPDENRGADGRCCRNTEDRIGCPIRCVQDAGQISSAGASETANPVRPCNSRRP